MIHDHKFALVPFHGQQLTAVEVEGQLHIAVKPVCDAIEIDWSSQRKRIQRDPVLSTCVVVTTMQVPGEIQRRDVLTIPLSHLNGFLFGISASRLTGEAQARLITYQRECYRVLHDYWIKGAAINPRANISANVSSGDVLALVKALKQETNPAAQKLIHAMLDKNCQRLGVETPQLNELVTQTFAEWDVIREQVEAAIAQLAGEGIDLNQHRDFDRQFAINIPMFLSRCREYKIDVPRASMIGRMFRRHPAFIKDASVNCVDGKVRHCWILKAGLADA